VVVKPAWYEVAPRAEMLTHLKDRIIGDAGVPEGDRQVFPEVYSDIEGVFTFRGGPSRTGGAFGQVPKNPTKLEVVWSVKTVESFPPWFGGSGWTGQPAIVKWPAVVRHSMKKLGMRRNDDLLVEVIQGSLDGHVYFIDLYTGKKTRPPLFTGNPIKGSVSLDPRGYPLLFVGQGIPWKAPIGLRAYELIDNKEVFVIRGLDPDAPRREWGAFDSSGLFNRATDTYVVGGENGLIYLLHLNTVFDPIALTLKVKPEVARYRYKAEGNDFFGIENSLTVDKNLAFFADNGGEIQALDLRTFTPIWAFDAGDDTDASITLEREDDRPVIYTGCEVDKVGAVGFSHLRKLDGLTGQVLWDHKRACRGAVTPKKIDAGLFATNVVGKGDVAHLVFFTLARCPGPDDGVLLALDKATGKEVWRFHMDHYSWSTPTAVVDETGHTYLLQGGIDAVLRLIDARDGHEVTHLKLDGEIESSPAVFNDRIVLGTRGNKIYGLRIR